MKKKSLTPLARMSQNKMRPINRSASQGLTSGLDPKFKSKKSKNEIPIEQTGKCLYCDFISTFSNIHAHILKEHGDRYYQYVNKLRVRKAVICNICSDLVSKSKLSTHMQIKHGVEITKAKPGRAIVSCPDCGISVRKDRLDKHREKVHGNDADSAGVAESSSTHSDSPEKPNGYP